MADENITEIIAEATTPADIVAPKKRRGPQPKKVALAATSEGPATSARPKGSGRKKGTANNASAQTQARDRTATRNAVKENPGPKAKKQSAETAAPSIDEVTDLLQLEEENARLRKALAEKLKAENADLRKRLGIV